MKKRWKEGKNYMIEKKIVKIEKKNGDTEEGFTKHSTAEKLGLILFK